MRNDVFEHKVKKELWYLNPREKRILEQTMKQHSIEKLQQQFTTPRKFVRHFLKTQIFDSRFVTTQHLVVSLIGLFAVNILLLGLFITGLLLSLSAVNYFISPQVQLSNGLVIAIFVGAIVLIIITVYFMKRANAYFTKRLLKYQFNKVD